MLFKTFLTQKGRRNLVATPAVLYSFIARSGSVAVKLRLTLSIAAKPWIWRVFLRVPAVAVPHHFRARP
jgi:hypothetical protein